ncbi:putative LSM domain, FDF domain, DFDF domain-containing protein [Rosa chinensis]|uniref:Putative LSM domain, FDF domain, DFDF domain-containing protein n=1 Tax=Rosa chinensis TaxID=74649 RepID=A0A2P6PBH3_ROSCH|nr:decapping 5-like protein isoform X1 [Rosa chinensis]PRQ19262.1 putative LSM domain, FDF domain, DFDF domain-containing protein [Rosa chinensis]
MATESGDPYIGSTISLISKYEIRYEGVLYFLSVQDSTIGLRNVKSYGTEGRKKDGPQVPPIDKVFEYILFRGSDIKDLQVKSPAPAQREEQIHNDDPAIIQSHYSGVPASSPPSALVGGKSLSGITQWQDTPALSTKSNTGVLPLYHSTTEVGPSGHAFSSQIATPPALSLPMYWQGYNGASLNMSQQPHHHMQSQSAISHQNKAPDHQASITIGLADTSAHVSPAISSSTSTSVNLKFSPPLTSVKYSSALDMPSSLATQVSLPSHSAPVNASQLNMPSLPSPGQDWNMRETQHFSKAISDPVPVLPVQSMPYPASSSVVSDAGPLLTPPPSLLTPDQLIPSRSHILSPLQKLYLDQKNMGAIPTPTSSSSLIPPPITQAPLLPLPTPQSQYSTTKFNEEFDFLAMNEKFKKDEVWGYLGKEKQRDETERVDDSGSGQSLDDKEGTKPAYNKDEFFDTISCNSLNRGARNGHRFSERMRTDSETFGNFQQRSNLGYGGDGPARGGNYPGPYQSGRGYGYGGRGRGGNMPTWW